MSTHYRLATIDWLRGLVMIIMTLDHVRDYIHSSHQDPMNNPEVEPGLYLTRWITHLCAPTFVFLTGLSAGLMLERKNPQQISKLLLSRGIWLIFLEITIITFAWKFNFSNNPGIILQVIWAIGVSMIALAGLVFLSRRWVLAIGIAIVALSNLLDSLIPAGGFSEPSPFWLSIHRQMFFMIGDISVAVAYPILAWVGIIACGFAASSLFQLDTETRLRRLLAISIGLMIGFVVLRYSNVYGDSATWESGANIVRTLMSFFNVEKYPPSLLYTSITLGIALLLLAVVERFRLPLFNQVVVFGRVPLLFYIAHLFIVHLAAVIAAVVQGFPASALLVSVMEKPEGYGFNLIAVYVVWVFVVALLFPLCHTYAKFKSEKKYWWLHYL